MAMSRNSVFAAAVSLMMGVFFPGAAAWAQHTSSIDSLPRDREAVSGPAREVAANPAPRLETAIDALVGAGPLDHAAAGPLIALEDVLPEAIRSRLDAVGTLHPRLAAAQREAFVRFYEERGFEPLWIGGTQDRPVWTAAARSVQSRIQAAGEDALEPSHYPLPTLGVVARETIADLAKAEIALGVAAVLYARDARGARIDVPRLHRMITPELDIPDADHVLAALVKGGDAGAALHAFNPSHRGYVLLRERLADLRVNRPTRPVVQIPEGPSLRVGMRDARVPLIRARFGVYAAESDDRLYDRQIASAVADFQRENGLAADGIIGQQTMAALLAEDPARQEGDIIANMERWRWLPSDLGARSVVVNIPEYMMRVMDGDEVIHEARAIVGRPDAPTPVFSHRMNHVVVNPSWTIPPSIMRNEVLPGLRADPDYALKKGYQVIRDGSNIIVRQPPGPDNALGMIKFMFPNSHHVYLHDTPNRGLFNTLHRAHSAGCVRIENPFGLADILLRDSGWGEERLRGLVGGPNERTVRISPSIPVHLTYFTLTVDDEGQIRAFADVYRFNQLVRDALGLDG